MPKRISAQTVVVMRAGIHIEVLPGQPFDFSDEELAHMEVAAPGSIRNLVNETVPVLAGALGPRDFEEPVAEVGALPARRNRASRAKQPALVAADDL